LIGSDNAGTADAAVANAVAQYGHSTGARVKVFWRSSKDRKSPFPNQAHRGVFVEEPVAESLLGATHHKMLREADFCIAIGGGRNTYNAALAAAFTRTRFIPVGTFGGAGQQLIAAKNDLRQGTAVRLPDDKVLARLGAASWRNAVDAVIEELDDYPRMMIVHGRDQDRAIVQRLLRQQGVKTAYVLAEQPRLGDSVLQKFQECARRSDAAVVLFTPDDSATPKLDADGIPLSAGRPELSRARQNVVLEYGWFWGAVSQDRVLVLVKGEVELPSDLDGLLYYQYDRTPEETVPAAALRLLIERSHRRD
jgi:predicted nucleotide-binding protein